MTTVEILRKITKFVNEGFTDQLTYDKWVTFRPLRYLPLLTHPTTDPNVLFTSHRTFGGKCRKFDCGISNQGVRTLVFLNPEQVDNGLASDPKLGTEKWHTDNILWLFCGNGCTIEYKIRMVMLFIVTEATFSQPSKFQNLTDEGVVWGGGGGEVGGSNISKSLK